MQCIVGATYNVAKGRGQRASFFVLLEVRRDTWWDARWANHHEQRMRRVERRCGERNCLEERECKGLRVQRHRRQYCQANVIHPIWLRPIFKGLCGYRLSQARTGVSAAAHTRGSHFVRIQYGCNWGCCVCCNRTFAVQASSCSV